MLLILFVLQLPGQQPPTQDPGVIFQRAQTDLLNRDYASAEKGFQEVLRLVPRSAAAYSNLGVV
jgi:TolA-binding protein